MLAYQAQADLDGITITAGWQRLRFDRSEDGRLRFLSEVRAGDAWLPVAALPNTFVQGASFELAPSRYAIVAAGGDRVEVSFEGDRPFPFQTTVSASSADPWLHVLVTARPDAEIQLAALPFLEPWCVLWLGEVDRLRWTQHDAWRQTTLRAPTRSSTGAPGNDLPAAYFYDVAHAAETCFYADVAAMPWLGPQNLTRFRDLEIGPVFPPDGRYGIGLHAARRSGNRFPAGPAQFSYKILQRHRERPPTEREALLTLIEACAPLLGPDRAPLTRRPPWEELAAGTLRDLEDRRSLVTVEGRTGHPAYLPEGGQTAPQALELMTQVDVLAPLCLLARADAGARRHADRLAQTLDGFWRGAIGVFANGFPAPAGDEIVDSWYFFENALIKLAWIARARDDPVLQGRVLGCLEQARALAHRCQYLFPVFYSASRLEPAGTGWNLAVNGLYAYACVLAADALTDSVWTAEAERALRVMWNVPVDLLAHEPQELAFGALAAAHLAEWDRAGPWAEISRHLVNAQLRMAYWYSDPTGLRDGYDIRGGFQACAGLLYPAFKENVESILPWVALLRRGDLSPLLLRVMDLQRRHNLAFFEPGSHIPYEDLATLELGERRGRLGRELYGAGEVFWMALCFDTVARADDPEICVVWLDVLDSWDRFPPEILRLAVFNPTPDDRAVQLFVQSGRSTASLRLAAGAARRLEVHPSGNIVTPPSA